ncbi:MAG: hypothetical protein R3F35_04070 [Myxococcota bacterium]
MRARYWPRDENERQATTRQGVIQASDVVDELAEDLFPSYKQISDDDYAHLRDRTLDPVIPFFPKAALSGARIQTDDPRIETLHRDLIQWLDRWQIRSDWLLHRAFKTLDQWCRQPARMERRAWAVTEYAHLTGPLTFEVTDWNGSIPLSQYQSRGREELRRAFDAYCAKLKTDLATGGKPNGFDRHRDNAYGWAVRIQVLGQPAVQVALDEGFAQSTVEVAVKALLNHIQLKARPRPPGRRKGSKDRMPRKRQPKKPAV